MMACTARWSSITFSLTCPTPDALANEGRKDVAGTSFLPKGAKDGGDWYPTPPAAEFRKKESHD